ncbi:hypothetical protein RDWZM_003160 [Blomia tropicalis]|uniref:Uncharacterized protein n=1 Tax=Blomia tropicalis TaxID=40697 RepID=A0A9Q0MJ30_BLOTA|nr:hypothetical protein BLOT_000768 [Blomia tropicalis]KAJ6224615.1 hypothetical protein RDWZM_003160 [Blomia tropicalis]
MGCFPSKRPKKFRGKRRNNKMTIHKVEKKSLAKVNEPKQKCETLASRTSSMLKTVDSPIVQTINNLEYSSSKSVNQPVKIDGWTSAIKSSIKYSNMQTSEMDNAVTQSKPSILSNEGISLGEEANLFHTNIDIDKNSKEFNEASIGSLPFTINVPNQIKTLSEQEDNKISTSNDQQHLSRRHSSRLNHAFMDLMTPANSANNKKSIKCIIEEKYKRTSKHNDSLAIIVNQILNQNRWKRSQSRNALNRKEKIKLVYNIDEGLVPVNEPNSIDE